MADVNDVAVQSVNDSSMDEIAEKNAYVEKLESDLSQIYSEIARCRKQKSGWKAATVIGSIGTVATGIGAGVQLHNIKKSKNLDENGKPVVAQTEGIGTVK